MLTLGALAIVALGFYQLHRLLREVVAQLVMLRREMAERDVDSEDSATVSAAIEKASQTLNDIARHVRFSQLAGAFPLEDIAHEREQCVFLLGKVRQREAKGLEGNYDAKFSEEDMLQFEFRFRRLAVMLQANQRVLGGTETVVEARARVAAMDWTPPYSGAEMGSGVESWDSATLTDKLLRYGLTFPDGELAGLHISKHDSRDKASSTV